MRPRRISDGTLFDSDVLKVVQAAFDEAWGQVGDRFLADEIERAREQLAESIINVARGDSIDVAMMRDAAIRTMAKQYPGRFTDREAGQSGTGG